MKFIRDIITDRSATDRASDRSTEPGTGAKDTPEHGIHTAQTDRTMTRLSDAGMIEDEDLFQRLFQDDAPVTPDTGTRNAHKPSVEPDTANLFDDLDEEIAETMEVPSPPLRPEPPQKTAQAPAEDVPGTSRASSAFGGLPGRSASAPTAAPETVAVPAPASGRSGRGAGRVKTRLLGFGTPEAPMHDPFGVASDKDMGPAKPEQTVFPVGWLVVIAGPGRGTGFTLHNGVAQIGRGEDQAIRLDFGDSSISRSNHAAIAYDCEQSRFYLGHGGKANLVRLNDRPVLSTEEITTGALIRIGETVMRFVALCDQDFSWTNDTTSQ